MGQTGRELSEGAPQPAFVVRAAAPACFEDLMRMERKPALEVRLGEVDRLGSGDDEQVRDGRSDVTGIGALGQGAAEAITRTARQRVSSMDVDKASSQPSNNRENAPGASSCG